jgi:hypothetical protein
MHRLIRLPANRSSASAYMLDNKRDTTIETGILGNTADSGHRTPRQAGFGLWGMRFLSGNKTNTTLLS